jgi:ABC-type lipoprotein export system ATPase subunit
VTDVFTQLYPGASAAGRQWAVEARGLSRIYSQGRSDVAGLRDVDLRIKPGELVALKGPSGSGKSTLLSLLGGLDRASGGDLTVAGHDLSRCSESALTRFRRNVVGMVFQSFNLMPTLSVVENVCLPALLAGEGFASVKPRALAWLEQLDMTHRASHRPAQLSGGEMQRTAIARALINSPEILLADEPTGNLDSVNGRAVMHILARLNRQWGPTVVIATHATLADRHAARILTLKDGKVVAETCNL